MKNEKIVIRGGKVYLGDKKKLTPASVTVENGKIVEIGSYSNAEDWKEMDASGCIVSPGFIDSHMHDEEVEDPHTIEKALLLQGVTTAIAGNCGSGPFLKDIAPYRKNPWLNLGYLTGHTVLREKVGIEDRYRPASAEEIRSMAALLDEELREGSLGLSFGLEYMPQTSTEEIDGLASVLKKYDKRWISVHIRYDGPRCLEGVRETVDMAKNHGLRVQVSHFGSMNAFGNLQASLDLLEDAWKEGVDITFDCYPYAAFCTYIGSAVFDPGFEERWDGKGLEDVEMGSGKYKGQRLNPESYRDLRKNYPHELAIAHVLNEKEVRSCLVHPRCAVASDGVLCKGQGHPRAAGTFPRALRWLREEGLSWEEALEHLTSLPADMIWSRRGRLETGAPADLVIFDPEKLEDTATFADQLSPPRGIRYVFVNGTLVVQNGEILEPPQGRFLRHSEGV
ncbi:MAG TPA: amidohydrolase family protein [Synergistaceae bacterium]|nr:amidohydrolase family protein [Synergistaceae bacterium]HPJ25652.1 amidohydrolase family protein [Synergistaceae bacterium]HPQ37970.1 amidohydrolase family protein [Synergistaceae bacterium]